MNLLSLSSAFKGFSIVSTNHSFNYSELPRLQNLGYIRGAFNCTAPPAPALPSPAPASPTEPSSPGKSSSSSGLSTGAKVGIGIGVSVALIDALLAAFLFKRRSAPAIEENPYVEQRPELGQGEHHEKTELDAPVGPQELSTPVFYEMSGDSNRSRKGNRKRGGTASRRALMSI